MCGYLRGAQQSGLMDIIVKDIKKYGNIFHACPFSVYDTSGYISWSDKELTASWNHF